MQQDLSPINTGIIGMCQGILCFISEVLPPTECGQCAGTLTATYGQRWTVCLIDVFRLLFHISSAWSNWFKTDDCHLIYAGAKRSNIQWRWPFRQFSSFSPPSLTGKCSDLSFQCGYINSEVLIHLYASNRFPVDSVYAHCGWDWGLCYLWHWYKNPFSWFNTLSEVVENECDHIAFVNTNLTWCVLTCQSTTALKQGF